MEKNIEFYRTVMGLDLLLIIYCILVRLGPISHVKTLKTMKY